MEMGAAALADRLEGDRALGKFRAVSVGQNRNFLHLVLINVGGLGSLVARVEQVCAIRRHGHAAVERAALDARNCRSARCYSTSARLPDPTCSGLVPRRWRCPA